MQAGIEGHAGLGSEGGQRPDFHIFPRPAAALDADLRLVTGEVEPARTFVGQTLYAGSINLSSPIEVRALAAANQSLVADIARLLEAGEQKKSSYRRIADKAVAVVNEGSEYMFCCKDCMKDFKKDTAKFAKKLSEAAAKK